MKKRKIETMLEFEKIVNYYFLNDLPFSLLEEYYELSNKQRGFIVNRVIDYDGRMGQLNDSYGSGFSEEYLNLPHNIEEKTPLEHDELMNLFKERQDVIDRIATIKSKVDTSKYDQLLADFNKSEIEIAEYLLYKIDLSTVDNFNKDNKSSKYYQDLYDKYKIIVHDKNNYINRQLSDNKEFKELTSKQSLLDDEIVKRNIKLANWVIRIYFKRMPFEMEEAQGYAFEGLMRAINTFDASRGNHFSTYAVKIIKRTIQTNFKSLVGLSWYSYLLGLEYKKCVLEYTKATGEEKVSVEDLYNSNLFGMSLSELRNAREYADLVIIPFTYLLPLDPVLEDGDKKLLNSWDDYQEIDNYEDAYNDTLSLATKSDELSVYAENKVLQDTLKCLIATLPDEEVRIIKRRYGFDDGVFYSMDKVANYFKISKDKVARVDKKIKKFLRHPLQAKLLYDFYLEREVYQDTKMSNYRGL